MDTTHVPLDLRNSGLTFVEGDHFQGQQPKNLGQRKAQESPAKNNIEYVKAYA
jgi:hypothetical protein